LPFSTSWAKDVLKVCDALACSINGMFLAACTCLILGRKRTFKKLLPNLCIKRGGGIVEWYLCFACPLFFVCLCLFGVKAFVVQLHVARNWIKWLYCLAATLCVFGCRGILQCQKMLKNYISLLTELTKGGKIKVWKRYKK
jgi:arginine exporter protein ArgO